MRTITTPAFVVAAITLALAVTVRAGEDPRYRVTPQAAHDLVTDPNSNARILDVRTAEEWEWVGHPGENGTGEGAALEGMVFQVSYKIAYKGGGRIINPSFVAEVDEIFGRDPNVLSILLCRSGGRG